MYPVKRSLRLRTKPTSTAVHQSPCSSGRRTSITLATRLGPTHMFVCSFGPGGSHTEKHGWGIVLLYIYGLVLKVLARRWTVEKSDTLRVTEAYKETALVKKYLHNGVERLHSDGGMEYEGVDVSEHSTTTPGTPQHNPFAERVKRRSWNLFGLCWSSLVSVQGTGNMRWSMRST